MQAIAVREAGSLPALITQTWQYHSVQSRKSHSFGLAEGYAIKFLKIFGF